MRIDLDKELDIPRWCPIEIPTSDGIIKGSIKITYKDQPWDCRRCNLDHTGECPKRMDDRRRLQEIREQKERETKTLIIGDSNLKLVNSKAILADVVTSSGAKIGHISNQLQFENVENYDNIVVFAGVNNISGPNERVDEKGMTKQVESEMKALETELAKHVKKGKTVLLTEVSDPDHVRSLLRNVTLRNEINKSYNDMHNRLKSHKKGKVDMIKWSPFHDEDDYHTVKAVSEKAIASFIQKIDEKIGIRATYLDTKLTADAYSNVTATYPLGCRKCTKMQHTEDSCEVDLSKKRNRSEESDQGPASKVSSLESTG